AHARSNALSFLEAERAVIGLTHDALGDLYTRASFFPERLQVGVGDHHEPALEADPPGLDVVVHLADGLVNRLAAGELAPAKLFPEAAHRLGLGLEEAEQVVGRALGNTGSILEALL
ncbi:MAG: HDOD domain-containing protein, partial [Proteobacteria bacterium]|nr:HDOD domain-containing protein [Pseudomonadota bacterium]MBU1741238.1 HDOD domain-containing protein [Pseudomonadota bacterium]